MHNSGLKFYPFDRLSFQKRLPLKRLHLDVRISEFSAEQDDFHPILPTQSRTWDVFVQKKGLRLIDENLRKEGKPKRKKIPFYPNRPYQPPHLWKWSHMYGIYVKLSAGLPYTERVKLGAATLKRFKWLRTWIKRPFLLAMFREINQKALFSNPPSLKILKFFRENYKFFKFIIFKFKRGNRED